MNDVIYLEFNNWFGGRDYPEIPNIIDWVGRCDHLGYKSPLFDDEWCKEQKICVAAGNIDMSCNFCITAPREWVEKNCPECLTDDTYTVNFHVRGKDGEKIQTETYSFKQFRHEPNKYGDTYGRFGWPFLEYKEENFGRTWYDETDYWDDDDDEEEDEE